MGMSTYIVGYISSDNDLYKKHAKVLIACIEAGIVELPMETAKFFGSLYPSNSLLEEKLEIKIPWDEYHDHSSSGYEIKVSDIPVGVEKIRFYNSY